MVQPPQITQRIDFVVKCASAADLSDVRQFHENEHVLERQVVVCVSDVTGDGCSINHKVQLAHGPSGSMTNSANSCRCSDVDQVSDSAR